MVKGILVPDALFIEDEHLTSRHIPEDEILIEHITCPHQLVFDNLCVHFFQVFDINNKLLSAAKHERLLEHNLLSVWKHLGVPAEVGLLSPSTGYQCK